MLFSLFKKPTCAVCRVGNVKDVLIFPKLAARAVRKNLCRIHFFDEYKKVFLSHPYKVVVLHPTLDKRNNTYGFYAISEMKKYAYQDDDVATVRKILETIPKDKDCAYFDIEETKIATLKGPWQSPALLPISRAKFLSKNDAYEKIHAALSFKQINFEDGFTVPYGEEGIFLTSLL